MPCDHREAVCHITDDGEYEILCLECGEQLDLEPVEKVLREVYQELPAEANLPSDCPW